MCEISIDVLENALQYTLGEQYLWTSQRKHRNSDLHCHYNRSLIKRKAVQRHEDEKNYMTTHKAAGYNTGEYVETGFGDDNDEEQVEEEDGSDIEDDHDEEWDKSIGSVACGEGELMTSEDSFLPSDEGLPYDDIHPLLIFYDCEATGVSIYDDNIIELQQK